MNERIGGDWYPFQPNKDTHHFTSERSHLIVVHVGFEGVTRGKGRRSLHVDHEGECIVALLVSSRFHDDDNNIIL